MSDETRHFRRDRQLYERLIVRVLENGSPKTRRIMALGHGAKRVEQRVDIFRRQTQHRNLSLQDFFIFGNNRVAENQDPLPPPKRIKNLKRSSIPRPKSGVQHVGVNDSSQIELQGVPRLCGAISVSRIVRHIDPGGVYRRHANARSALWPLALFCGQPPGFGSFPTKAILPQRGAKDPAGGRRSL